MDGGVIKMDKKLIASCALTVMLIVILLVLAPNQTLTTHEIEGALIGLFSALLIESVWKNDSTDAR